MLIAPTLIQHQRKKHILKNTFKKTYTYLLVPFIAAIFTTYSIPNYYTCQQVSGNMYENTCSVCVTASYPSVVT